MPGENPAPCWLPPQRQQPLGSHGVRIHTFPIRTATTSLERAASSCSLLLLAYFLGYVKARLTEPGASARAAELLRVPAGSGG